MNKLKIGQGIRDMRKESKQEQQEKKAKEYWQGKVWYDWENDYGRERKRYYNINGWGIEALKVRDGGGEDVEVELISRKDTQRQ